jgi:hypothetical protein
MHDPFAWVDGRLHCDAVSAEQLVAEYGTPLYVYSETAITERYRAFAEAFAEVEPIIAYSVKANGNLSVLRLLAGLGAGADIVSGGELHRALLAGVPPDRILFSGVGKTIVEMAAALDAGIFAFNVESEGELRLLSGLADTMGATARVALRVNPDVETATPAPLHGHRPQGHEVRDRVRGCSCALSRGGVTARDTGDRRRRAHRQPDRRRRAVPPRRQPRAGPGPVAARRGHRPGVHRHRRWLRREL